MNILFINPPNKPFTEPSLLIEPIDVLTIASYTESLGHKIRLLDMDVKQLSPPKIEHYLKKWAPEIIILVWDYHIPLHTTETTQNALEIATIAKSLNIHVIAGGKIATYMPEKLIGPGKPVDIAIAHDMEAPLTELLQLKEWTPEKLSTIHGISFLDNNKLTKTPPQKTKTNLKNLPLTNRNLVDLTDYIDVRTILSSRGCMMKCTFCHVPGFWGEWKAHSPEHVVQEIEQLVTKHNATKVLFLDDNATIDPKRMKRISELILEKNVKVKLGCLGTLRSFDEDTMKIMYKAGFRWIHYGIESGDSDTLSAIQKPMSPQHITKIIKKTKAIGFRVRTSWILDLPNQTQASLQKTTDLILATQTDEIRIHFLALRMGSTLYNQHGEKQLTQQYIHNNRPNVILNKITANSIIKTRNKLTDQLQKNGYTLIQNAHDFRNINQLRSKNPDMKIVSLCPLRYGLNWEKE